MSRKFTVLAVLGILGGTIGSLTTSTSVAQPVYVAPRGGVHVRAPFVSVDVDPYGGVSVRAPFTAVDIPGRARFYEPGSIVYGPPAAQQSFPTAQELAAMDDATLRQTLRSTANRLHDRFARFDTGDTWQRYFRLPEEVVAESPAATNERRAAFARLLQRFNDISANPQYGKISKLPAFIAMQAALTELLSRDGGSSATNGVRSEELPGPQQPQPTTERSLIDATTN